MTFYFGVIIAGTSLFAGFACAVIVSAFDLPISSTWFQISNKMPLGVLIGIAIMLIGRFARMFWPERKEADRGL